MSKETTKKQIEVMEAYVAGAKIQVRKVGPFSWQAINYPNWNWLNCEYRVEPFVSYIHLSAEASGPHVSVYMHDSYKQAVTGATITRETITGNEKEYISPGSKIFGLRASGETVLLVDGAS